jgi:mono/diheme cytochrome c family protein
VGAALAATLLWLAPAAFAQELDRGRALYDANGCYQCHGHAGQGGAALRIAPTPYPLEAFATFVRRPPNEMPAYARDVLSDEDLSVIYRYVRSIPEPPAVADIPLLR